MKKTLFPHHAAFPLLTPDGGSEGLSIREYFSALAMQGILASCASSNPNAPTMAKRALEYADALIEELNKTATK